MGEHEQGGHRYAKADEEIAAYFTCAVGVRAQSYQGSGGGDFDSDALHEQRMRARSSGTMAWFDRVGATLAHMPPLTREILATIYTPHAWPAAWLASALATPWGGGSMVSLALTLPRAPQELHGWLLDVDRPALEEWKRRTRVCAALANDAEELRLPALAVYDLLRVSRCKAEATAKRAAMSAAERKADDRRRKDEAEQARMRGSMAVRVARALEDRHAAVLAETCAVVAEAMARRAA